MTFQHRAGVSPYTSPYGFAETYVFAKQLREPLFCGHFKWLPLSRSYGVILPSSLTRVLPFVLGFSPRPPVSVCGTGACRFHSSFSCQREFSELPTSLRSSHSPALVCVLHYTPASLLSSGLPSPDSPILLRHCFCQSPACGSGIST